jgi:peptidoglycan/LPS O-acetylase OafA/YrhL
MSEARQIKAETAGRFFLPSLEGLRFIAFFLVFLQHLPRAGFSAWFAELQEKGAIGVDIFFALSAFLLCSLAVKEQEARGRFDFKRFMLRRVLRILPLLYVYAILNFAILAGVHDLHAWARLGGTLLLVDNFLCWIDGYAQTPATAHLWTLSFEMQMYPLIPVLALAGLGRPGVLPKIALALSAFALAARAVFVAAGAVHPVIWVTPFLRPESILAGLLLAGVFARGKPARACEWTIGAAAVASFAYFLALPMPHFGPGAISIYLVVGTFGGGAVWAALRVRWISGALTWGPIAFLGRISYGLYVYHLAAILLAARLLGPLALDPSRPFGFVMTAAAALSLTVVMATVSFLVLERPFLRLKTRFEFVPSSSV